VIAAYFELLTYLESDPFGLYAVLATLLVGSSLSAFMVSPLLYSAWNALLIKDDEGGCLRKSLSSSELRNHRYKVR
jgi:hypothetical protein